MEATPMKLAGVIGTAVLSLALGAAAPAYAQQDQQDKNNTKQEEKNAQQQDKNTKQEEKSAQQQDKNKNQDEKSAQQQNKNNQQEQKNAQQQDRNNQQENRNAQQRTQQAEPAKQAQRANGSRIPDDRYRANFGREHSFRVSQADYGRDRRFQYGGYWFGFVDEWPSNWLYTQDVFVVEIDGMYYLCNPMYPGINVALSVTL
jgi:phage repressor protein C with HTH and peptisase S24 domain